MILLSSIVFIIIIIVSVYMRSPQFGAVPKELRLERIKRSPYYRQGAFSNMSPTPNFTNGYSVWKVLFRALTGKFPNKVPSGAIDSVITDLKKLSPDQNVLVWFGHSSYLLQISGKKFLIDPVLSGHASPIANLVKAFDGSNVYRAEDFPEIDYLILTHDHFDHVDYKTLVELREKVNSVICSLGVGAHLERWKYKPESIIEKEWNEKEDLGDGLTLHCEPARHFSGRTFKRNNTLWSSFLLQTPDMNIFLGGDSGYDSHYKIIGQKYHQIDLAILELGQYDEAWAYIHHHPQEVLQAALDLKAKRIIPVHNSKFALANHAWDEPLSKITALNQGNAISILTPRIGEVVYLHDMSQQFDPWWEGIDSSYN